MKIAVAGIGYVGLSMAVLLSQHNEVVALDIIKEKVDALVEVKMKEGNRLTRGHDFTLEQWMYKEVEELTAETRKLDRSLNNDVETLNNTFKSIIKNLDLAYFNSYDRL